VRIRNFLLRPVRARHLRQFVFQSPTNLHRIDPGCLTGRAGDIELAFRTLSIRQKHGGYLQPTLLVHLRRTLPAASCRPPPRPRFLRGQTRKCGLHGQKCHFHHRSGNLSTLPYSALQCLQCPTVPYSALQPLQPTTAHYSPLPCPTSAHFFPLLHHIIGCFPRMSEKTYFF